MDGRMLGGTGMEYKTIVHPVDFCVVGGGLAGLFAAVEAARHGVKTALVQERPMLGGNASSEIRMWICGASCQRQNRRESGLLEELELENLYRNPDKNYSVWDGILYEMARNEENLTLLLNCSVNTLTMKGSAIESVTGWQMTTQEYHRVEASLFADCSGDSVLAPLSGADWVMGREAREAFGEEIGLAEGDRKTMGMSCMIQARQEDRPSEFIPPKWAYHFTAEDLPHRIPDMSDPNENFWYLEVGGDGDSIADTEKKRDELLRLAYGLWDYVKNAPENRQKNANWRLDWVGILPGKRESRRCLGDVILTQMDVQSGGYFPDVVAYGGWSMDDHDPRGFYSGGHPNVNYPVCQPYGIPYRCLYSRNVDNLFFAGRNISVTHWALSSTRVMGTCATLGQAVGAAASLAVRDGLTPRGVYEKDLAELQAILMEDDSYLPHFTRPIPPLTAQARLQCGAPQAENLRDGLDRPIGGEDHGVLLPLGQPAEYLFDGRQAVHHARIVWDSDLNRETMPTVNGRLLSHNMLANRSWHSPDFCVPATLTRAYRLEGLTESGWVALYETAENHQRLNAVELDGEYLGVRLIPLATWGAEQSHVFSFDVR